MDIATLLRSPAVPMRLVLQIWCCFVVNSYRVALKTAGEAAGAAAGAAQGNNAGTEMTQKGGADEGTL
eukprot:SAG25_NODE_545_length_7036_cov_4.224593_2_plen_68_part_00